ncbi:MAG TPA: hypothetical protein VGK26_01055 [Thermoanaerobaculia bacterium]
MRFRTAAVLEGVAAGTGTVEAEAGGRVELHASVAANGAVEDGSGSPILLNPFRLDGGVAVAPPVTVIPHLAPGSYRFVVPGGDKAATYYSFTVAEGQTTTLALP